MPPPHSQKAAPKLPKHGIPGLCRKPAQGPQDCPGQVLEEAHEERREEERACYQVLDWENFRKTLEVTEQDGPQDAFYQRVWDLAGVATRVERRWLLSTPHAQTNGVHEPVVLMPTFTVA
jgi:hypothetical protein